MKKGRLAALGAGLWMVFAGMARQECGISKKQWESSQHVL
jgi:hypothetical protein